MGGERLEFESEVPPKKPKRFGRGEPTSSGAAERLDAEALSFRVISKEASKQKKKKNHKLNPIPQICIRDKVASSRNDRNTKKTTH